MRHIMRITQQRNTRIPQHAHHARHTATMRHIMRITQQHAQHAVSDSQHAVPATATIRDKIMFLLRIVADCRGSSST
jgi:hypothetical protein